MPSTQIDRIDGVSTSMAVKVACRAGTLGNITLSGLQTVDGIALAANDRVLVKNQSNAVTNGIYTAQTTSWVREPDFDGARDAVQGTAVQVENGTSQALTWWNVTTPNPFVIAQDAVNFGQTFISLTPVSQATETAAGIAEIETQAETNAGTDDLRFVTAKKIANAIQQQAYSWVGVFGGTANALTCTLTPAPASLVAPLRIIGIASAANTTAMTVNANGLGAKAITRAGVVPTPSGLVASGMILILDYDGVEFQLTSHQPTLVNTIYTTAAGVTTYTKKDSVAFIDVELVAGGAQGGGCALTTTGQSAGAGGSAGGYSRRMIPNSLLSATTTVTNGAGGSTGVAGAAGQNGSLSSFGTFLSATPGTGGAAGAALTTTSLGAAPTLTVGIGSSGDLNLPGGYGDSSLIIASSSPVSGAGGASFFGAGGAPIASTSGDGIAGVAPGSGGSGAGNAISQPIHKGGAGANGIVIIREYA